MDANSIAEIWKRATKEDKGWLIGLEQDVIEIICAQRPSRFVFSEDGEPKTVETAAFVREFDRRNPNLSSGFRGASLQFAASLENGEELAARIFNARFDFL